MSDGAYSNQKIFHHRGRIDAMRAGAHLSPIHVQIIPTNVCNQRCRFCSYRQSGYSSNETFDARQSIPFTKLAEIVDDCETMGVRAIEVTGGGEPTCHPEFLQFCELIAEAGIDLGLVTNGSNWSEAHVAAVAQAKWVRFSIDAGCAGTYATIRRVRSGIYEKVRDAIRQQHASRIDDVDQLIGVGFVVTADNWTEVVQATERARDDGADNIRLSAVFQNDGARYFDGFGMEAAKLCREASQLATDTFRVFDLFSDRVHDLTLFQRVGGRYCVVDLPQEGGDCHGASAFRRDIFLDNGGYSPKMNLGEDRELRDRLEAAGHFAARTVGPPTYLYRWDVPTPHLSNGRLQASYDSRGEESIERIHGELVPAWSGNWENL